MTISVRVEKSGRVLIPAAVRRRLGLKEGESDLLLDIDESPIRVTTRAQALVRLQEAAARYGSPDRLWSEELIEERREEARKELA
jgi:AbrB family transcriptional regulator (stage V sporulation protein T)